MKVWRLPRERASESERKSTHKLSRARSITLLSLVVRSSFFPMVRCLSGDEAAYALLP